MKLRTIALLCASAMQLAAVVEAADYVSLGDNVALSGTAYSKSGTASYAIDGNTGTRWESSQADGEWFYVDLGGVYALDQLQLVWEGAYTKEYNVYVADEMTEEMSTALAADESEFTSGWTLATTVNEELSGFSDSRYTYNLTLPIGTKGRYVAIDCVTRGTVYGNSLWEFRVLSYGAYNADGSTTVSKVLVESGLQVYIGETATVGVAAVDSRNCRVDETPTLSCDSEGVTISGTDVTGVTAGTYTLTGTAANGVTGEGTFTVREEAKLSSLTISVDLTQGATIDTYAFTVSGLDQFGETFAVSDSDMTWNVDCTSTGTATFSGNKMTVDARGQYTVSLTSAGVTSNEVTINVVAEGSNLALGKTVVSYTDGSTNPDYAVDGNGDTMWETAEPDGTTDHEFTTEIVIDLGETFSVNCVETYWEGASSADYTVTFSTDNSTWTGSDAFTVTDGEGMTQRHDWLMQNEAISARYVKLTSTKASTGYGVKLRELRVFSNSEIVPYLSKITIAADNTAGHVDSSYSFTVTLTDQTGADYELGEGETGAWTVSGGTMSESNVFTTTETGVYTVQYKVGEVESNVVTLGILAMGSNLALGKDIVSSTDGSTNPGYAVDGNTGTAWIMEEPSGTENHVFEAEIVVDLGAEFAVNSVDAYWEGAAPADYTVTFSTDNSTWTTVTDAWTLTGGVGMSPRHDWFWQEEAITARYVKIHTTKAATEYGVKLLELYVYSASEIVPVLSKITIAADYTIGHVSGSYNFTIATTDQTGADFTPTEEGVWTVSGGTMSDSNVFTANGKGDYTVKYSIGDIESNEVTISIVASGNNIFTTATDKALRSETDGYTRSAAYAVDGDSGTDWFIKDADNSADFEAEFVVDLNAHYSIDAAHLYWEGANAAAYTIQLSNDGLNYSEWQSFSEDPNVRFRNDWFSSAEAATARYVKLSCTQAANGGYGYRLYEFELYGDSSSPVPSLVGKVSATPSLIVASGVVVASEKMARIEAYSLNGSLVASAAQTDRLSVVSLERGVYVVKALGTDGSVVTAKIVR